MSLLTSEYLQIILIMIRKCRLPLTNWVTSLYTNNVASQLAACANATVKSMFITFTILNVCTLLSM